MPSQQQPSVDESIDYDEHSESEDEFPELPVAFRSMEELNGEVEDDTITFTRKEIQERDLRHAEELERHANELESLYSLLQESTQKHNEEIQSMERRFRRESEKWDDILEKALSYAEELEASNSRSSDDYETLEIERLRRELEKRDELIEDLRAENLKKDKSIRKMNKQKSNNGWWTMNRKSRPLRGNPLRKTVS